MSTPRRHRDGKASRSDVSFAGPAHAAPGQDLKGHEGWNWWHRPCGRLVRSRVWWWPGHRRSERGRSHDRSVGGAAGTTVGCWRPRASRLWWTIGSRARHRTRTPAHRTRARRTRRLERAGPATDRPAPSARSSIPRSVCASGRGRSGTPRRHRRGSELPDRWPSLPMPWSEPWSCPEPPTGRRTPLLWTRPSR